MKERESVCVCSWSVCALCVCDCVYVIYNYIYMQLYIAAPYSGIKVGLIGWLPVERGELLLYISHLASGGVLVYFSFNFDARGFEVFSPVQAVV